MESELQEAREHRAIVSVLKNHFGHSAVEADMEDAAWSILTAIEEVQD